MFKKNHVGNVDMLVVIRTFNKTEKNCTFYVKIWNDGVVESKSLQKPSPLFGFAVATFWVSAPAKTGLFFFFFFFLTTREAGAL